jgi:hypothetical protein
MDTAALVISSVVAALVVLATLGIFIWAARKDGEAQRREDEALGIAPAPPGTVRARERPGSNGARGRRAPRDRQTRRARRGQAP